ncbi:hypothetical protein ABIB37_000191 [Agrococcus sp. UYP10]|uniref:DUF1648 domain-containing protein n=1 Tax=Agrococcus sp. UYP10 TaxID=1756355 RepID=UPI00339984A6
MDRARVWLAALVLALPPSVIAATWAALAPRLPASIATHWSDTGVADGISPTVPTAVTLLSITGAMLVAGLVLAAVRLSSRTRATLLSLLAAVSGMLAAAWVVSAVTTVEAGSAQEAVLGPWLALLLGAVLLLLVPWLIHPRDDRVPHLDEPVLPLAPTDERSWRGEARSTPFLLLGIVLAVGSVLVAAVLPIAGPWLSILVAGVLLAGAAIALALARIRVTVDADGLRVRGALVMLPLRTIPLERIRVVEAHEIEPLGWGGWGYRGLPGHLAIVLRRGPGIVVTTREGSRFAVTVDDAQQGASTLAGLVARARDAERGVGGAGSGEERGDRDEP